MEGKWRSLLFKRGKVSSGIKCDFYANLFTVNGLGALTLRKRIELKNRTHYYITNKII
jgi:hypothetical protein